MFCAQNGQDWLICFQCITAISPPSSHLSGSKGCKCMTYWVFTCPPPSPAPSKMCLFQVDVALPHRGRLCFSLPATVSASPHCSFALLQALGGDSNTENLPGLGSAREASEFCAKPARRNAPAMLCWAQGMQSSSSGNPGQEGRVRQC